MSRIGFAPAACAVLTACGAAGSPGAGACRLDRLAQGRDGGWPRASAHLAPGVDGGDRQGAGGGQWQGDRAEGALFEPDRAPGRAMSAAGAYKYRVFALGAQGAGMRDFAAYP